MENYRMGRYDDHHRPMDGVLNAQGSMMDTLAKLRDLGDGLAERYREGWDEHREGIQERRDEFREEFQERLDPLKASLSSGLHKYEYVPCGYHPAEYKDTASASLKG